MIYQKAAQAAEKAIRALDVDSFNARLEQCNAEEAEARSAIERAQDRQSEIARMLSRDEEERGALVADALLAGQTATEAADVIPAREVLIGERNALNRAMTDLQKRIDAIRRNRGDVEQDIQYALRDALAPLTTAIRQRAEQAAEELAVCYADARAIDEYARLVLSLRRACASALEGISGTDKIIARREGLPVSPEVIRLQDAIRADVPGMKRYPVRSEVPMPH